MPGVDWLGQGLVGRAGSRRLGRGWEPACAGKGPSRPGAPAAQPSRPPRPRPAPTRVAALAVAVGPGGGPVARVVLGRYLGDPRGRDSGGTGGDGGGARRRLPARPRPLFPAASLPGRRRPGSASL